jgi:hypothetical protein
VPVWVADGLLALAVVLTVGSAVALAVVAVLEARHYRRLDAEDAERGCCCRHCDSVTPTWSWPPSGDGAAVDGTEATEER